MDNKSIKRRELVRNRIRAVAKDELALKLEITRERSQRYKREKRLAQQNGSAELSFVKVEDEEH